MSRPEIFADQMSRVHLMSEDDCGETWDLSSSDCAALKALLDSHGELLEALEALMAMVPVQHREHPAYEKAMRALAKARQS